MKTLFFDLETTPILGYVWRAYEDNLLSVEQDSNLLAVAWCFNSKRIHVCSTREYKEKELVKKLWELMDEADVIVAQNGDRFDIKVANTLFQKYGLQPPSPYKTVDTLKMAKKYFRFTQNKLDYLAEKLLGERKLQTDYGLWKDCMAGNEKALRKMERYCRHDVRLLVGVYHKLKPWHTGHPNTNLYKESTHKCPVCGGNTQKRGFMYTRVGVYQRYQCTSCGAWSKGEKINKDKVIS